MFKPLRNLLLSLAAVAALLPGAASAAGAPRTATAVLAGGCFWGMSSVFEHVRGVDDVVSGFAGGASTTAHYETVSTGTTGHAESVEVIYEPAKISYAELLQIYFTVAHDPTELNRQGPDSGTQYRSAIFYADAAQRSAALAAIRRLTAAKTFPAPIVTQVEPLRGFYAAEAYHQHYARNNPDDPYIVQTDAPKLAALAARYPRLLAKN